MTEITKEDVLDTWNPQMLTYAGCIKAMGVWGEIVSKQKDEEIAELREKVNELTMADMTHEYNNAEAERFAPEYERQIKEPLEEEIAALKKRITETKAYAFQVDNDVNYNISKLNKKTERLMKLLEQEYRKTFRGFGIQSYIDKEWQQFKTDNNL